MVNKFFPRKGNNIGIDKLVKDTYVEYPLIMNELKELEMKKLTDTEIKLVKESLDDLTNLVRLAYSNFPRSTGIEVKTSGMNPYVSLSVGNNVFEIILDLAQREMNRQEKSNKK